MVGSKSIYRAFKIKNLKDGSEVPVLVQADKSLRICDIIFPSIPSEPQLPSNKEELSNYKVEKALYDASIMNMKKCRQDVMNYFRGCQFNDSITMELLRKALYSFINA